MYYKIHFFFLFYFQASDLTGCLLLNTLYIQETFLEARGGPGGQGTQM